MNTISKKTTIACSITNCNGACKGPNKKNIVVLIFVLSSDGNIIHL
jgi:hypothetical protein